MKAYLILVFEDRKFVFCDCNTYLSQNKNPNPDQVVASIASNHDPRFPVAEVNWFDSLEEAASWIDAYPELVLH